jgi:uncharacterized protein DUF6916
MIESFTPETFTPHLGTTFRIQRAEVPGLDLELITVTPPQTQPPASPAAPGRRAPFSLLFRGPRTPVLPQRIYSLGHARLGTFDLFLVPIGPDAHGMCYEAVFG